MWKAWAGGLGAVGSLVSLWVAEQTSETHLWLLGRSGRGSWDPWSAGDCQVTLARSDVSAEEEARFVVQASGQQSPLQVKFYLSFPSAALLIRSVDEKTTSLWSSELLSAVGSLKTSSFSKMTSLRTKLQVERLY